MSQPAPAPDVVVIGGGPGGSAAATMLARGGARVLLLEAARFPRDHVGESLLPASVPILEELGALPAMQQAGFLLKWGATMVWGRDKTAWSWYFKETNSRYPHSYQVWRPQFDQILLDNCRASGVEVLEGCRVVEVLLHGGKAAGVRFREDGGGSRAVAARFVVDASGQGGVLARQLELRRWDPFFRNLAVYGYFDGARRLPEPDATNIFIESYGQGWLWTIPLHTGRASVGAVVDAAAGQEEIRRAGPLGFLTDQLAQAPHTGRLLREATLSGGPHVVKDWSYVCRPMADDGYALVGDAACFVDPLFSSGVHLALMSGVLAAAYVTSSLKDEVLGRAAGEVYEEQYLKEYNQFREMARLFYSTNLDPGSYFWEARKLLDDEGSFSPRDAFIRAVAGQPPRGYERAVLDHGSAPPGFLAGVGAVEEDRKRRQAHLAGLMSGPAGSPGLFRRSVPRLAAGVGVRRKPVVGQGEFEWGHVVTTPGHPEGAPCSSLVARAVSLIDGRLSVAGVVERIAQGLDADRTAQAAAGIDAALQVLYIEGAVQELSGPQT